MTDQIWDIGKYFLVGGPVALLWWEVRRLRNAVTWEKLEAWCKSCKEDHEKMCKLKLELSKAQVKGEKHDS